MFNVFIENLMQLYENKFKYQRMAIKLCVYKLVIVNERKNEKKSREIEKIVVSSEFDALP